MYGAAQQIEYILGKKKKWFFTGYSKKDALKSLAFDAQGPTENAYDIINRHYKKNKPLINEGLWDGGIDGESCAISHYMMFLDNPKKASLFIELDERVNSVKRMIHAVNYFANSRDHSYVVTSSKGYCLNDKNVFPDRLYVGWMLYVPHIILPELIPEAAKVVPVVDNGRQKGTIIVSTEDVFDGDNPEHIAKANDIEIRLLDLGFLPLMTDL